MERLEHDRQIGSKTGRPTEDLFILLVHLMPQRYTPKQKQELESEDEESDDDDVREMATALLYAKVVDCRLLEGIYYFSLMKRILCLLLDVTKMEMSSASTILL